MAPAACRRGVAPSWGALTPSLGPARPAGSTPASCEATPAAAPRRIDFGPGSRAGRLHARPSGP
jgi:hypothetical protein